MSPTQKTTRTKELIQRGRDQVEIERLKKESFIVTIVGMPSSDICTHKFPIDDDFRDPEKPGALGSVGTDEIKKRPKRIPWKEMIDAMYVTPEGYPALTSESFKAAMANATMLYGPKVTKKSVYRGVFVWGENDPLHVEIYGNCYLHAAPVKIGMGLTQVRFRPAFRDWWANVVIDYYPSVLSKQAVVSLLHTAGENIGAGEMRPDKCGKNFGRFVLADEKMIKDLNLKKVNNWRKVVEQHGGPKNISLEGQRVA